MDASKKVGLNLRVFTWTVGIAFVHQIDNFSIAESKSFFVELMPSYSAKGCKSRECGID